MRTYHANTKLIGQSYIDDEELDDDYELRQIPIIDTFCHRMEDYEYYINDTIYSDIRMIPSTGVPSGKHFK